MAEVRVTDDTWLVHFTRGWLRGNPGRNVNVTTDNWLESILGLKPLSYCKVRRNILFLLILALRLVILVNYNYNISSLVLTTTFLYNQVDLLTRCIKLTNDGRKVKFDGVKMGNHGLRVSAPKSCVISTCYRHDRSYEVGLVANKMRHFLAPSRPPRKYIVGMETALAMDSAPVHGLMSHHNFSVPMNSTLAGDENVTEEFYEERGSAEQALLDWVDAHGCVGSNKSLLSFEKVVMGFQNPLQQDNMHWLERFVDVWTESGPYPPVTSEGWLEMACTYPPYSNEPPKLLNFNQVELVRSSIHGFVVVCECYSLHQSWGCVSWLLLFFFQLSIKLSKFD